MQNNKKQVAISTLVGDFNIGNRLQNYALQHFLKNNFDVEVKTIKNNPYTKKQKFLKRLYLKYKQNKIANQFGIKDRLRRNYFKKFNKNIVFDTQKYYLNNAKKINEKYDFLVVGSDQVWNSEMSDNLTTHLLYYVDKNKRVSYAASLGKGQLNNFEKGVFERYIKTFNAVSVREETGRNLIQNFTDKKVECVVDPTLLLTKQQWQQKERKPKQLQTNKFVLLYMLGDRSEECNTFIKKLKEDGYEIVDILNPATKYYKAGPAEFLYLERNASLVVADSFHAIVFAIINKVPFVHVERQSHFTNMTSRMANLERIFNTKFNTLKDVKNNNFDNLFNYKIENVDSILEEERKKSLNFLTSAFEKEPSKNNNLTDVDFDCSGCGLCKNICPVGAISLQENEKGFIHPVIDPKKCVKCGLCLKNCSQLRNYEKLNFENGIYALKRKDEKSGNFSSTGIFGSIAKKVLSENGAVFGVKYNSEKSSFIKIETEKDLEKIEGSKYFQVDVSNIYKEVEKCLEKNQKVLVGATPCQITGLRRKFKFNSNLILMQVVCHGVPPQKLFNRMCVERFGEIPKYTNFRSSVPSWYDFSESYEFKNKETKYFSSKADAYMQTFLSNKCLNNSCYNCKYAGSQTGADIIVGDCWDIKKIDDKFYSEKGVSILTYNTVVGKKYFEYLKEFYNILKIPKNKYKYCNINLFEPINMNINNQYAFYEDIKEKTVEELFVPKKQENKKLSFKAKVKRKLKRLLRL